MRLKGREHCKDRLRDEGRPSHETNSINRLKFFVIKCDNLYGKVKCIRIIKTFFTDHSLPTCTFYCPAVLPSQPTEAETWAIVFSGRFWKMKVSCAVLRSIQS